MDIFYCPLERSNPLHVNLRHFLLTRLIGSLLARLNLLLFLSLLYGVFLSVVCELLNFTSSLWLDSGEAILLLVQVLQIYILGITKALNMNCRVHVADTNLRFRRRSI